MILLPGVAGRRGGNYTAITKTTSFLSPFPAGPLGIQAITAKWGRDKKPRDQWTGLRTHSGSTTSSGGVLGAMAAVWHTELHLELEVRAGGGLWTGLQELILLNLTHHPVWEQAGMTQRAPGEAWCSLYPLPTTAESKELSISS